MPEELTVHVNRQRRHAIEVADGPLETPGSFEVVLVNHGAGAHVHLGLDGDLAAAGAVETPSPFLDAESTERVLVRVDAAGPFGGALTLSTGYGQSSIEVPVRVLDPEELSIEADPRTSGSRSAAPAFFDSLPTPGDADPATLGLVALGAGALLVAVLVASLVESGVVLAGVVTVVAAVAGALAFLVKQ